MTVWINGIVEEPKPADKKDENKPEKKADKKGGEAQQKPPEKKDAAKDTAAKADQKPPAKKDEKKEEKKAAAKPTLKAPTIKLFFGKRDKDLLYVRREMDGKKADFAVPESLLPKLTRGRLDYLDPTLPSFTLEQATKLTFTHGGETWAIEKVTKDKEPTDLGDPATG